MVKEAKLFSEIFNISLVEIIEIRIKRTVAEKWCSTKDHFMKLFKAEKKIFQIMDEIRDMKEGKSEYFEIFNKKADKLVQTFREIKPSEEEIHKNILLGGATDPSIVKRFAFEPEMPRENVKHCAPILI